MTLRFYIDEDAMDREIVRALRSRGGDVMTAADAGLAERTDADHLEFATREGRVLYSFNVGDFHRLHTAWLAEGRSHAGIVVARQQAYSVGEQMRRLLKLSAAVSAEGMENRLEFLGAWGDR